MEYVWGLHPFIPEHDDEIEFKTGERILVTEKDDLYQDGWWKGTNAAGKTGLFPQSYTTNVPPASVNVSTPSKLMGQTGTLSALAEDDEPESPPGDGTADPHIIHQPQPVYAASDQTHQPGTATVLHATMTDIQEAIEQLGVGHESADNASRSFSFASTKEGTATDDDDDRLGDPEFTTGWNKDARSRLAANATKQQSVMDTHEAEPHRPPIDVEMSDESEDEGEHQPSFASLGAPSTAYDAAQSIPDLIQATADAQAAVHAAEAEEETPMTAQPLTNGHGHARHESEVTIAQQPTSIATQFPATPRQQKVSESTINTVTPVPVVHHASSRDQLAVAVPAPSLEEENSLPAAPAGDTTPPISVTTAQAIPLPSPPTAPPVAPSSVDTVIRATSPAAPVLTIAEPASGTTTAPTSTPTSPGPERRKTPNPPSEWNVEDVVAWLRSKKFDEGVCAKFIEHEITGDILLELDANMLKEVDIAAFGKRMKIANAIAELRRPPSMMSSGPPQSFAPSTSGQSRVDDGLIYSPESAPHTGDFAGTPVAGFAESRNGGNRPPSLTLTPDDHSPGKAILTGISTTTSLNGGAPESSELKDGTTTPEAGTLSSHTNMKGAKSIKIFGRSTGGSVSSMNSLTGASPTTPATMSDVHSKHQSKDSSLTASTSKSSPSTPTSPEEKVREKEKGKGTMSAFRNHLADVSSGSRHSFFGGNIGKSRKPAPRYSESQDVPESQNKPSRSLSRLYLTGSGSHKRSRISGSTPPSSGVYSGYSGSDAHQTFSTPNSEADSPTRTASPLLPGPPDSANSADPLNIRPGRSVVEQIGYPDREGWMRKKGERYNTWKLRYFVLKGPHLYYLRSQAETKIKGYINIKGYRIMADENANPGRYGFRIFHEGGATHWFSSDEQVTVREWMKALMKATIARDYSKPVMSSVNIPTIPLQVAQAMSPAPRPPSPTQRDATQRALRRENPNQLSSRDARILMGLPSESGGSSIATTPTVTDGPSTPGLTPTQVMSPVRPTRDLARTDSRLGRRNPALEQAQDAELIEWINKHIPNSSHKATDMSGSLATGLVLYRLAESIKTNGDSDRGNRVDYGIPDVPDSVFPSSPNDTKLDGLFVLFDFLLDNDVRTGHVTINDVRSGNRDQMVLLVKALKAWEDKKKEIENHLTRQVVGFGPYTGAL